MRNLTSTLLDYQKKKVPRLQRLSLTANDVDYTYYYNNSGTNKIIGLDHTENGHFQSATVLLDNHKLELIDTDFLNLKAALGYGAPSASTDEYSDCAPLWVQAQKQITDLERRVIGIELQLEGAFNLMAKDSASADYTPEYDITDTVKTLMIAVAAGTLTCFSHVPEAHKYTITWDDEDALADVVIPAESLRIKKGDNRYNIMVWLLSHFDGVMRMEGDGNIHIFVPITSTASAETLRPNANGDESNLTPQGGGDNYVEVDEVTADAFTTYVEGVGNTWLRDLYNIGALTATYGTVKNIVVTGRCYYLLTAGQTCVKLCVNPGVATDESAEKEGTGHAGWANYTETWTYNPDTNAKWTISEIASLQVGVSLRSPDTLGLNTIYCTQVFVTVTYEEDYEYSLESGKHHFFNKSYRTRLLNPSYIQVDSLPSSGDGFTGSSDSGQTPTNKKFYEMNVRPGGGLTGNEQATAIATALRKKLTLDQEVGSGKVSMNCGQEVFDYVKVVDKYDGQTRYGNVGYIRRVSSLDVMEGVARIDMYIGFGKVLLGGFIGGGSPLSAGGDATSQIAEIWRQLQGIDTFLLETRGGIIGLGAPFIQTEDFRLSPKGTWTNNSPDAGKVAWADVRLVVQGSTYAITDGNTANPYIWWDRSGTKTAFTSSADKATFESAFNPDTDCLIAYNDSGTHRLQTGGTYIHGGCIWTGSIFADLLEATLVLSTTIICGTVDGNRVELSSSGVSIIGKYMLLKDSNAVLKGAFYYSASLHVTLESESGVNITIASSADLSLFATSGQVLVGGATALEPRIPNSIDLGTSGGRWGHVFGDPVLIAAPDVIEGCLSSSGAANGIMYVYASGAWRLNDVN